ncbi:MAG: ankyrin repeat domain-containing protein [Opitutaceae bacterium]|nr:ankyrin repeat domain-containing protein [Opitutaceae bacterium]
MNFTIGTRALTLVLVGVLILAGAHRWINSELLPKPTVSEERPGSAPPPVAPEAELFRLARSNDAKGVQQLMERGTSPTLITADGETALSVALASGSWDVALYCLTHGFDPKVTYSTKEGRPGIAGAKALLWAARQGRADIVEQLIALGAQPNGYAALSNPLAAAVSHGHHNVIRTLVRSGARDIGPCGTGFVDPGIRTIRTETLLTIAADRRDLATLKLLLELGLNVEDPDTPVLFVAVRQNWPEGVRTLMDAGFDPTVRHPYDGKPIESIAEDAAMKTLLWGGQAKRKFSSETGEDAARREAGRLAELLYGAATADIKAQFSRAPMSLFQIKDRDGWTLLFHAVKANNLDLLRQIVGRGISTNLISHEGISPAGMAVQLNNLPVLEYLTSKGANLELSGESGNTPLYLAVDGRNYALFDWLLAKGVKCNRTPKRGLSPLMTAVVRGEVAMSSRLLQAGANPNSTTDDGFPVIFFAATGEKPELVKLLEERGASLKAFVKGASPLVVKAINSRDLAKARKLLELGVPVPPEAMHFALGRSEFVELVKEYSARGGGSASQALSIWPLLDNISDQQAISFLERGGDPNYRGGYTALQSAVCICRMEVVKKLIEKGADPNQVGLENREPILMTALYATRLNKPAVADDEKKELIRYLVGAGADLEAKKQFEGTLFAFPGQTTLMASILRGSIEITRTLLDLGADPMTKDDLGRTAFDYLEIGNNYTDESRKRVRSWLIEEKNKATDRKLQTKKKRDLI